ncbi:Epidermal retinol dehydrogenase 2, partial [Stegodyphus mimosarum]
MQPTVHNTKKSTCETLKDFIVLVGNIVLAFLQSTYRCIIPKSKKSLKDEIVLITGAGRGLGKELALKFAEQEAFVVLWDINEKSVLGVESEIRERGGSARAYTCDVSNENHVKHVGKLVQDEVGDVTILVNNAGIFHNVFFTDLDCDKIRRTIEVNLLAHFWMNKFFLPKMLEMEKGHIVAISSIAGLLGWLYMSDYSASKFAMRGMMEAIEEEIRILGKGNKIFFTTVCPLTLDNGLNQNPTTRCPLLLPIVKVKDAA